MTDDSMHDALEAYVIGALDGNERAHFEQHLATCDACRDARDSYASVLASLADLDIPAPPPVPRVGRTSPARSLSPRRDIVAYLAVAATLAIFTSVALPRYEHGVRDARTYAEIADMLATNPVEVALVGSRGVSGRAIVGDGHHRSGFIVRGLPEAAPGLVYRVWLRGPSFRRAAGTLERMPDGLQVLVTPGDAFAQTSSIRVMLEPANGSANASRTLVLHGTIG